MTKINIIKNKRLYVKCILLPCLLFLLATFSQTLWFVARAEIVPGVVLSISAVDTSNDKARASYYGKVNFVTLSGDVYEVDDVFLNGVKDTDNGLQESSVQVGDNVNIFYNPSDPRQAYTDSVMRIWWIIIKSYFSSTSFSLWN
jgi:hypothetical protein